VSTILGDEEEGLMRERAWNRRELGHEKGVQGVGVRLGVYSSKTIRPLSPRHGTSRHSKNPRLDLLVERAKRLVK
jgi:hypothetical protein